jgi:F-type H+-transporting ATPase subunit epsilon
MPASFTLALVTPEAMVLDTSVEQVIIPAHDGEMGILHGRAPLVVTLGAGWLTLDIGSTKKRFYISGGFAQMKEETLTVLADEAIPEDKITPAQIAQFEAKNRQRVATRELVAADAE